MIAPMSTLTIVSDAFEFADALQRILPDTIVLSRYQPSGLPDTGPGAMTIVDANLRDPATVGYLKAWLKGGTAGGEVAFFVDRRSAADPIQALALGATCVLPRPVEAAAVAHKIASRAGGLCDRPSIAVDAFFDCISAPVDALRLAFRAAASGTTADMASVNRASTAVVDSIADIGLKRWLEVVHGHHSRTYQHSLIVTGIAVSFAEHMGASRQDRRLLATAGLLHDIGKARVPISILEKPGQLTPGERQLISVHPQAGYDALRANDEAPTEVLDMVLNHHEYLDGSGYPNGLTARQISDHTRIITISDVFGALIERRAYKAPLSGTEAYRIVTGLGPKLDRDLVRAFAPVARLVA